MKGLVHWDEVEAWDLRRGPMQLDRIDLGDAAGSVDVGVARLKLDPGGRSSPVHVELDEEEIFYVLGGSGLSWQDEKTYEVGPGDCIVHRVAEEAHTLIAGPDGLDVLAFGERTDATASYLPRAGVVRMGVTVEVSQQPHPWDREAAAGELGIPEPSPRPTSIVNVTDVRATGEDGGEWKRLGAAAGSVRTGLNWGWSPGPANSPIHCHSEEEEIYVVLEGSGTLVLVPTPQAMRAGTKEEEVPIRAGHVISRLPGTRIAHGLRAGEEGMTFLGYGTRRPSDITYYPLSNKIAFRGLGLIARLEDLAYSDEPD
jgi:uncharacterized cupin superfamily protein